jgi:hypothetical protein
MRAWPWSTDDRSLGIGLSPGADAADAVDLDVHDDARWRLGHGQEDGVGSEVDPRQAVQQLRSFCCWPIKCAETISSPSRPTQTTVTCGLPSGFRVTKWARLPADNAEHTASLRAIAMPTSLAHPTIFEQAQRQQDELGLRARIGEVVASIDRHADDRTVNCQRVHTAGSSPHSVKLHYRKPRLDAEAPTLWSCSALWLWPTCRLAQLAVRSIKAASVLARITALAASSAAAFVGYDLLVATT